ncbi:MAG TPA: PASTA domain-containing protein, partial [Pseudonocardiaceae bacterium]|nr:PASTA domain-containing protein [Pseudonocardiaceae bacterium]
QGGSLIALTVSAPHSTVPPVIGAAESSARQSITVAGLTVGAVTRVNNIAAAGNVIGQSLAGGSLALTGAPVALTVSLGPAIPNVLDDDPTTAGNVIRNAGYVFGTPQSQNDCKAPGLVEMVDPQVGTTKPPGTVVTVTVSTCARTPGGGGGVPK